MLCVTGAFGQARTYGVVDTGDDRAWNDFRLIVEKKVERCKGKVELFQ